MPGRKSPFVIWLEPPEQAALEHLVRSPTPPNGIAQRARIILSLAAGVSITHTARLLGVPRRIVRGWGHRFRQHRLPGLADRPRSGRPLVFSPAVAVHLVKLACERPDELGRSLSPWDCRELARDLEQDGIVEHISPATVRRILVHHQLKPWRHHLWLSPTKPRDAEFYARVSDVVSLYIRRLRKHERVMCVDEKTSLQSRGDACTPLVLPCPDGLIRSSTKIDVTGRSTGLLASNPHRTGLRAVLRRQAAVRVHRVLGIPGR